MEEAARSEFRSLYCSWNIILVNKYRRMRGAGHVTRMGEERGTYRGAGKSLARPTPRCILFDDENISFDASLVIYIYIYMRGATLKFENPSWYKCYIPHC